MCLYRFQGGGLPCNLSSLMGPRKSLWVFISSFSCCKYRSDDLQALYMSELKLEVGNLCFVSGKIYPYEILIIYFFGKCGTYHMGMYTFFTTHSYPCGSSRVPPFVHPQRRFQTKNMIGSCITGTIGKIHLPILSLQRSSLEHHWWAYVALDLQRGGTY